MARSKKVADNPEGQETRGRERFYEEQKVDTNLKMTPTAISMLKEKAAAMNLSRSEFVERVARGIIPLDLEPVALGESSSS